MQSDIYDLVERHTLVLELEAGEAPKPLFDRKSDTMVFPPPLNPKTATFEVALFIAGQGNRAAAEQPTLERNQNNLIMQIVGSEGAAPLKLPEGVNAGDSAEVTILGRSGRLEVLPLSPPQIPEVSDEMGWLYNVRWTTID